MGRKKPDHVYWGPCNVHICIPLLRSWSSPPEQSLRPLGAHGNKMKYLLEVIARVSAREHIVLKVACSAAVYVSSAGNEVKHRVFWRINIRDMSWHGLFLHLRLSSWYTLGWFSIIRLDHNGSPQSRLKPCGNPWISALLGSMAVFFR